LTKKGFASPGVPISGNGTRVLAPNDAGKLRGVRGLASTILKEVPGRVKVIERPPRLMVRVVIPLAVAVLSKSKLTVSAWASVEEVKIRNSKPKEMERNFLAEGISSSQVRKNFMRSTRTNDSDRQTDNTAYANCAPSIIHNRTSPFLGPLPCSRFAFVRNS
jgi:hypothetical protein